MKVLFCTNIPSPYRVDFFNELGKKCDLTVCYERRSASDRDKRWIGKAAVTYKDVYLDLKPIGSDRSFGSSLRRYIATNSMDWLILTNYVSPACIEAITYCKFKNIPFWIEYDGGFNKYDSFLKGLSKKFLLGDAIGHLTTSEEHIAYLKRIKIAGDRIYKYPFSSITQQDLIEAKKMTKKGKDYYRKRNHIIEPRVVLAVGQFIYRKGFDLLIKASIEMRNTGIYLVGGEPTDDYLNQIRALDCNNVHLVGFKTKAELAEYYCAADIFVLPTREDIWGLVINEAMSYGLPIVTTERCLAGAELVQQGGNGWIVPVDDTVSLTQKIIEVLNDDILRLRMSLNSFELVKRYTIENMAARHMEILNSIIGRESDKYNCVNDRQN